MKIFNKINCTICCTLFFASLSAQNVEFSANDTVFTRDIDIIREYTPTIKDAGKINTLPKIDTDGQIKKTEVNYASWTSPLESSQFDLSLLPSATLKRIRQQRLLREGYARIGAGNYTSFVRDLYTPIIRRNDMIFDVLLNHQSSFGKVRLENDEKVRAKNMINSYAFGFDKNFIPLMLTINASYARNDFNYYGLDSLKNDRIYTLDGNEILGQDLRPRHNRDAHNFFTFDAGIISNKRISPIDYAVNLGYDLTKTYTGLAENMFDIEGKINCEQKKYDVGGILKFESVFYNSPDSNNCFFRNITDEFDNYSILRIAPYYRIKGETWHIKLGFKSAFTFNRKPSVAFSPDINAKVAIVRDVFYFYADVTGDLKNNTMKSIFNENKYFRPDNHTENTYCPIDATVGFKTKIYSDLIFNISGGYKMLQDAHFFVNNTDTLNHYYDNTFSYVTDNVNLFTAGAAFTYNWQKRVEVMLEGNYYHWVLDKQPEAWNCPKWKVTLDATYRITDDIKVTLDAFMYGARYARGFENSAVKMKPVFDINVEGVYELNSWLAFFAKFNNVIAQNYQIWYGYNSQRFNFMAGMVFSF